jgi:putative two-component system response regulator
MNTEAPPPTPIDRAFLKTLSVLYVEDEEEVRELLARYLRRWVGALYVAANGLEGVQAFAEHQPDLVVTDIKMPVMDGLEMASVIKMSSREVPIIVITAYSEKDYFIRAIEIGVDRYVTKPVNTDSLLEAIYKSAKNRCQQHELAQAKQVIIDTLDQTIGLLARAIEMRDPYTDGHQKRVSLLAVAIAEEMGVSPDRINGIRLGSLVHDVGKIRIPAEILTSPRNLTHIEMDIIKTHSQAGYDILAGATFPWPVAQMVLEHHERMDGSGYPNHLSGEAICLEARIICVADVVESMASFRPYRPALGIDVALDEIRKNRGMLYDENVVDCCISVMEKRAYNFWE